MQGNERKRKQMSFHFLSLIFGIRTFQGVTADSNKKKLFPGPAPSRRLHLPQHWPPKAASGSAAIGKSIAQDSDFRNTMSPAPCRPNRRQVKTQSRALVALENGGEGSNAQITIVGKRYRERVKSTLSCSSRSAL
jgi:hypothetical protein